jgi:hypothetical protein
LSASERRAFSGKKYLRTTTRWSAIAAKKLGPISYECGILGIGLQGAFFYIFKNGTSKF